MDLSEIGVLCKVNQLLGFGWLPTRYRVGRMSTEDGAPGLTGMGRRHRDGAGPQACAGTAATEVSHLTRDFGGRTAVADVSFSVARGEVSGPSAPLTNGTSPASGSVRGRTTTLGFRRRRR
jgi:hypothetical protein